MTLSPLQACCANYRRRSTHHGTSNGVINSGDCVRVSIPVGLLRSSLARGEPGKGHIHPSELFLRLPTDLQ